MPTHSPVTTPFGFEATPAEVLDGVDLTGARAIVTGGTSGLGAETARTLAAAGADVVVAARDLAAGERAAADMIATSAPGSVRARPLDLADPHSVAAFVDAWEGPLHLLINNAGVMALPERTLTPRGWERQFAVNHVGHFALAVGLHDALAAARGARIVSLTSRGHLRSPVVFDDLHFDARPYEPFAAYGQSKTANVLFAVEATRRWAADGITANAVFPGVALETGLARHVDTTVMRRKVADGAVRVKTIPQAAAQGVLVATAPQFAGVGGRYVEDGREAAVVEHPTPDTPSGVAAYAVDPETAARLWEVSEHMITEERR